MKARLCENIGVEANLTHVEFRLSICVMHGLVHVVASRLFRIRLLELSQKDYKRSILSIIMIRIHKYVSGNYFRST